MLLIDNQKIDAVTAKHIILTHGAKVRFDCDIELTRVEVSDIEDDDIFEVVINYSIDVQLLCRESNATIVIDNASGWCSEVDGQIVWNVEL